MAPLETPGRARASVRQSLVGVSAPYSWVLVHTRFCLCPPRVYFPVLCKFWQLNVGLMVTSSKRTYAIPKSAAPEPPPLWQTTTGLYLHRRHSNTVLAQSLWGLGTLRQCVVDIFSM